MARFVVSPRQLIAVLFTTLLASLLLVGAPTTAHAQSRSFEEGPVVRRQLLFRSSRFEVTPSLGTALAPIYQREIFVGASARYFLNNSFGIGANLNVGLPLDTSLAENYRIADPIRARELQYVTQTALADVHISVSPVSGKLNIIGDLQLHYDVYLTLGGGGAFLSSDADDLAGIRFGGALGAGLRTFINDKYALNFQVLDYLYTSADAQRITRGANGLPIAGPIDESFRNHFLFQVGFAIFLPGRVSVSR